jgi:hypothetical protein
MTTVSKAFAANVPSSTALVTTNNNGNNSDSDDSDLETYSSLGGKKGGAADTLHIEWQHSRFTLCLPCNEL